MNSRRKGKDGELELAAWLRDNGIAARRGQQFSGSPDSPDIVHAIAGVHLECKRTEKCRPYEWLAQAIDDSPAGQVPIVAHRQSRKGWIAILDLGDLVTLLRIAGMVRLKPNTSG